MHADCSPAQVRLHPVRALGYDRAPGLRLAGGCAEEAVGMTRFAAVLAGLVLTVPAARAQEEPIPWAQKFFSKENPPPRVIVHDFGTVPHGTMLSHRFPITNIYNT